MGLTLILEFFLSSFFISFFFNWHFILVNHQEEMTSIFSARNKYKLTLTNFTEVNSPPCFQLELLLPLLPVAKNSHTPQYKKTVFGKNIFYPKFRLI